ncbi:MAG: ABC transporter ATP-binding protein [Eubacteriales bacterium]
MANEEYRAPAPRRGPPGGPPGGGEQAKDFKAAIKKLTAYAKKYHGIIGIAVVFAMMGSCLTLVGPSQLSNITDEITAGMMTSIDMDTIKQIGTTMAIIYVTSYFLSLTQGFIMASTIQKISKQLRKDISQKINHLPMGYFSRNSKGDVLSRVTNDVDSIGQTLTQSLGTVVSSATLLVGSLLMMYYTNAILATTALLSVVFGFIFMILVMKNAQKFFRNQQKYLGAINGHIEEMYAGHTVVKAYNGEAKALEIFNEINGNLKLSAFKAQALSGLMMPVMTFIGNFGYVAVCIVGAILALDGTISFGTIVAFMVYIRLFTQPLGQLAQSMQQLQSASAASERVFEFLEEEEMEEESHKTKTLSDIKGDVEFKNVNFGYLPEKTIIHNFSAKVEAGQKIAIVGPTGAGKTTIVNLLMRFFEVNSGEIFIDGISTQEVKRPDVHGQFSMVLQDTWIFQGTLRENLVYATENISQETVEKAVEAVGLTHFVSTLENGYDTQLSSNLELSQGQKQQITIARAMIADKPMLILDEATSSIDTRTELLIQKAMDELMESRTSFVIAHRLSTIKNADLILVMKDGDIIETGNHEKLLAEKGFYSELYNSQFDPVDD